MSAKEYDLICVGEAIVDMIPINHFTYKAAFGGAPMNTAVAASKLGLKVGALTSVGTDAFGEFLVNTLRSHGIDVSRVKRAPHRTTLAIVVKLPGGEREFFFYRKPWSLSADTELALDETDLEYASSAEVVHVSGFILSQEPARTNVLKLIDYVKNKGTLISFDPTFRPDVWPSVEEARKVYEQVVRKVDFLLLTLRECEVLFKTSSVREVIEIAKSMNVKLLGIKMGKRGGALTDLRRAIYMPTYEDVEVKDTVGAGDAWNAAIVYSRKVKLSLEEMLNFAHATATIKCMHVGAISGLPNPEEVVEFIKRRGKLKCRELKM